jgi:hypothetical protein
MGHLGDRVSALLDGQLPSVEEERAWTHVHTCHQCRDLVEREGWVKTRLAGLSFGDACAPSSLKGSLMASISSGMPPGDAYLAVSTDTRPRRASLVALGGGAAGAAVMGVLALGAAPADAPTFQRPAPSTVLVNQSVSSGLPMHQRRPVPAP